MNEIFKEEIAKGWLEIYMDNLLIHSPDLKMHRERTHWVLCILEKNNLYLKLEKCEFEVYEVEYLGMIIWEDQIEMEKSKLARIADWPAPKTVKRIWQFLGFANFYCKFIEYFVEIAKPLKALTRKDIPFTWGQEEQHVYETLKEKFKTMPVLKMPDPLEPFVVKADVSKWASGGVLQQQDLNGDWHPCGFILHSFTETKWNYNVEDWELLAIIQALDMW